MWWLFLAIILVSLIIFFIELKRAPQMDDHI
ncbi:hypothetical protein JOC31_000361 [Streptococcus saliviloxodontae]|uniref:Uncharacterized protein n=1 Tax=Streptococcus saliviloxodontae TaxID=1349416 RepID=A0ABS2PJF9_9STRE|nr:hypothetical protein [Streptococcus saliviloxodontae]